VSGALTGRPRGVIERFRDRLPVTSATPVVTLAEGDTPLLPAARISERCGLDVWLKYEGANPTGSFKDRGMTLAVSKALEEGATAAVCASTGNTSASAAAYCARAGLALAVLLPEGAIARGKLAQAQIAGARVLAIQGGFDDALALVRGLVERRPVALLNSINPYRLEGQKTAAFEVLEQAPGPVDWLALPVGNGGNISAYWQGFEEVGGSARPPGSRRRSPRCARRAAPCARCRTPTSCPPTGCWRRPRACSASRRRPRPWRPCSRPPATGRSRPGRAWCASSPGTG
jgi:threonine synthase